jgi:hypothetical protein
MVRSLGLDWTPAVPKIWCINQHCSLDLALKTSALSPNKTQLKFQGGSNMSCRSDGLGTYRRACSCTQISPELTFVAVLLEAQGRHHSQNRNRRRRRFRVLRCRLAKIMSVINPLNLKGNCRIY